MSATKQIIKVIECTACGYRWISKVNSRYHTCPRCGFRRKQRELQRVELQLAEAK